MSKGILLMISLMIVLNSAVGSRGVGYLLASTVVGVFLGSSEVISGLVFRDEPVWFKSADLTF